MFNNAKNLELGRQRWFIKTLDFLRDFDIILLERKTEKEKAVIKSYILRRKNGFIAYL